jgi:hypothetical protein
LGRVEEALGLVKTYDRVRYNRLIRDLERVLVTVLSGSTGSYNSSIGACQLDERFVLAGTSPAVIASAIVHEAAHARLQRRGVGYQEEIRSQSEHKAFCPPHLRPRTDFSLSPSDLSGPSFLAFYIGVAIIVVVVAKLAIDAAEGGAPPALPLGDPYQIAWLRGGTAEAARIAVLALTDRGLLAVYGDNLVNAGSGQSFVREPIERAMLSRCAQSGTAATAVLDDPGVERACAPYQAQLERLPLMPDAVMRARRYRWFAIAAAMLLGTLRSR